MLRKACSCTSPTLQQPLLCWAALSGTLHPPGPTPTWWQSSPTPGGDSRSRAGTMSCATVVFGEKRPFLLCRVVPSLSTRCLWEAGRLRAFCCVFTEMLYGHCSAASCSLSALFYSLLCVLATTLLPVTPCPPAPLPSPALGDGAWLIGEERFSEKLHKRRMAHTSSEGEHAGHTAVSFPLQPCCTFHFWLGRGVRENFVLLL